MIMAALSWDGSLKLGILECSTVRGSLGQKEWQSLTPAGWTSNYFSLIIPSSRFGIDFSWYGYDNSSLRRTSVLKESLMHWRTSLGAEGPLELLAYSNLTPQQRDHPDKQMDLPCTAAFSHTQHFLSLKAPLPFLPPSPFHILLKYE